MRIALDQLAVDLLAKPETERAQEDRRQKLSLSDANVKQILLIVFKLNPRTAVRNDLGNIDQALFEKDARAER